MVDAQDSGIDLTGQVVIVTGGGRGIGRAIALGLASAGASVAVVARSEDQITETVAHITQAGGRALALPADVSDPEAVASMIQEVERALGPVDLLVNNAGIAGPLGPIAETDPGEWWRSPSAPGGPHAPAVRPAPARRSSTRHAPGGLR
jgi:NAD(P)-dependent dehydrogenase (short-subunit alcohol dehydrogenase family)